MTNFKPLARSGTSPSRVTAVTAIAVEELACQRGGRIVVEPLSFKVRSGNALVLRGYLRPASGRVLVSGPKGDTSAEGFLHYIGHANGIKPRLSVIENVSFWQRYYGSGSDLEGAEAALDAFDLLDLADYWAAHLSQGQTRRLGLARLLAAPRPIWLLDEPSVSLDAASTIRLEAAIARHLSSGGLAIVSTHLDLSVGEAAILDLSRAQALQ